MKRFTLIPLTVLLAALAFAGSASAQIELYATNSNGAATDFVYAHANTVSLRGTMDPPTQGEWVKVRQVNIASSCPTATGSEVPVLAEFNVYVSGASDLPKLSVSTNVDSSARDSRFCIYAYYDSDPKGESVPNKSYSQDVHFRDAGGSIDWFDVASAISPELPFFSMTGTNELQSGEGLAFVAQSASCPASYPGGSGAMTFAAGATSAVLDYGEAPVAVGFWRACAYFLGGSLAAQDTFSRAPRGGWKPKYSLKRGKVKVSGGRIAVGKVKCPGPCSVTVTAVAKGKKLARGVARGSGTITLRPKATAAGRKAAKRGVKATFKVMTVIDESTAAKRLSLKLRS